MAQAAPGAGPDLAAALRRQLSGEPSQQLAGVGEPVRAGAALRRFYAGRDFLPAWHGPDRTGLAQLLTAIEGAAGHGLEPADYHAGALRQALAADDALAIELLATDAYLTLAAHLLSGRLDPVTIEPDWTANARERDLVAVLGEALPQQRISASLAALAPGQPAYAVLREALALYRQAARDGGWQPIGAGPYLQRGASGPRVRALRQRLRATGLLAPGSAGGELFDAELESAVLAFQRRVGVEADGVVGPATLRQLNQRPSDRIEQIRANLERWRWLPEDLGERHLRVNIADFRLEAWRDGRVERRHDVIVGRTYRMTPVFSGAISYLVFNPWWETPDHLARADKLPEFRHDPSLVTRLGFEVLDAAGNVVDPGLIRWEDYSPEYFPFRLRQRPGPENALGRVKFMFPNKHRVYLHDTPAQELFARSVRAFSSGCVRVSDAVELAQWVLEETPDWSRARIDTVLASGAETLVSLARRLPVHILYFTAVSEPDGSLRLIDDVYGRDARLIAGLHAAPPSLLQ